MNVYETRSIRNIALASHQGAGKTSLTEAILFINGVTNRLGQVAQGNTVSDYDQDEISRGMSLHTSLIPIETRGLKFNFLDTPGFTDFQGDVKNALRVADSMLMLIDASAGVEVGTEIYWGFADEFALPRIVVANKMARDTARQPDTLIGELSDIFKVRFVPLQLPIGQAGAFKGVVDLLSMKAYMGTGSAAQDRPADLADEAAAARVALVEAAAESEDALMEKYFEAGDLSADDVVTGLKKGLLSGSFVPVVYTDGTANVGVTALFDLLTTLAPSPQDRGAIFMVDKGGQEIQLSATDDDPLALYVFKTTVDPYVGQLTFLRVVSGSLKGDSRYINQRKEEEERFGPLLVMRGKEQMTVDTLHAGDIGAVAKLSHTITCDTLGAKAEGLIIRPPAFPKPVYAVAVTPATQADSAKMGPTLTRLCDEDPTLQWHPEPTTKETVMEGMGDIHVDVAIKRAAQLGVHLNTAVPKVPYRETVTKTNAEQYRHKKQTGGAGQFAEVHLRVEPMDRGEGFEYTSEVHGGSISQSFIPSIEKGIRGVLEQGVIAGYPVVDVRAVVYDGKEHPVDSKDIAFQIAGREVFKLAFKGAGPVLLEPVVTLRITVPETNMGDVIGDLSSRRAQVLGTESISGRAIITAQAPLVEVQRYSNDLRSFTQGRGVYTLELSHYQNVPAHLTEQIIAAHKREEEEAH